MARTLLKLVQNILSDMDSDEVNSIYDTVEALQVASIVMDTLESEFNNLDFPCFDRIVQLESASDVSQPNTMRYPAGSTLVTTVRYRDFRNTASRYVDVAFVPPADFFERQQQVRAQTVVDPSGVRYGIWTDRAPRIYTSVDNVTLIFDAYDSDYEDTLEATNSFVLASTSPSDAALTDDYVFPIPDNLYPLLKAEAKAVAFLTLKQMANPKSEQIARRQRSRMQHALYRNANAGKAYARSKFNFARTR